MPDPKRSPDGPASAPATTPEPLAAILADYRADIPAMTSGELPHPTPEYLRILLDRIEAAAERERASLEDALSHCKQYAQKIERENEEGETRLDAEEIIATVDNEFAGIRPERAPGNAAAIREALEKIRERCVIYNNDLAEEIDAICGNALAAPARNCDRFATAKDALDAFIREKEIKAEDVDGMNLRDFFDWLFDKAEGGAK